MSLEVYMMIKFNDMLLVESHEQDGSMFDDMPTES